MAFVSGSANPIPCCGKEAESKRKRKGRRKDNVKGSRQPPPPPPPLPAAAAGGGYESFPPNPKSQMPQPSQPSRSRLPTKLGQTKQRAPSFASPGVGGGDARQRQEQCVQIPGDQIVVQVRQGS